MALTAEQKKAFSTKPEKQFVPPSAILRERKRGEQRTEARQGFLSRLKQSIGERATGLKETGESAIEQIKKGAPISQVGSETRLRVLGEAAGAVTDVIGAAVEPALRPTIEKIAETEAGAAAFEALGAGVEKYEEWKAQDAANERLGKMLESAVNIADIAGVAAAPKAAAKAARKIAPKIAKEAAQTAEKQVAQRTAEVMAEATNIYKNSVGVNKKQIKLLNNFKDRFDSDMETYLVEHSLPLATRDKGAKFATREIGQEFKKETLGLLGKELDNVLDAWKDAELMSLEDLRTQVKSAIDADDALPGIDREAQLDLVDKLIDPEIKRFGDSVDVPTGNKIKRNMWKLGFEQLSPQKKPTAQRVGRILKERIETVTGSDTVRDLNNEMAKAINAADFLEAIDGDAVRGGRMGKSASRIVGTIAGAKLGVVPALISGEVLTTIISKLGDVTRLSEDAIQRLRQAGVIPSSVKTVDDARDFLEELIRKRREILKLPEPAALPEVIEAQAPGILESQKRIAPEASIEGVVE